MRKLFLALIILVSFDGGCFTPKGTVEERIAASEGLSRVNKICLELPKPDGFILTGKNIRGNNRTYDVGYLFKSKYDFNKTKEFYSLSLPSSGWNYDENNSYPEQLYFGYRKGKFLIVVSKIGSSEADYVIQCQEEH